MSSQQLVYVETQIVRTGRGTVHERYGIDGRWLTDERCNLDDADTEVMDTLSDAEPDALCRYCFKPSV